MLTVFKAVAALYQKPGVRTSTGVSAFALVGLGMGLGWGSWARACAGQMCPSIAEFEEYQPSQSLKFYAADGRLIEDRGESRTVVALEEMSSAIPAAFLSVEDKRFFQHNGVDAVRCLGRAVRFAITFNVSGGGCSSITMQLARIVFPDRLPSDRTSKLTTVRRKVREVQVALDLERTYPKERILELYLNQLFLGGSAHGVESASQRYFGKSARDLNVAEAATLAAMAPVPNRYNPRRYPDRIVRRRNLVIGLMAAEGFIAAEDAAAWQAYPLRTSSRDNYSGVAEYFVEWVRQQMVARFGSRIFTEGYQVYTTLDLDTQLSAERALEDQLERIENQEFGLYEHQSYRAYLEQFDGSPPEVENTPYLQGAVITMDAATGHVRAMVGGRNFRESKFNRATQAARQPGSTFKPFVYSAAIRSGRAPAYVIDDRPVSVVQPGDSMPWEPQNFEEDYRGPMTLRQGLRQSRNLIAIRLGMEIGVSAVVGEALGYGLSTRIPEVPSTFIGSASVLPLDMVAAYSTFANLGERVAPQGVLRVEDADGNIVWQPGIRRDRVLDQEPAWLLTDMMVDVANRGTGYRIRSPLAGPAIPRTIPVGGKTGTTNDGGDVWFIGFTPELVTGVWLGFDQPQKIKANSAGGALAAPVFAALMSDIYERRPAPESWTRPASLVTREIDMYNGYLATPYCPRTETYFDWFIPGTEPTEFCPIHGRLPFGLTGMLPPGDHRHPIP